MESLFRKPKIKLRLRFTSNNSFIMTYETGRFPNSIWLTPNGETLFRKFRASNGWIICVDNSPNIYTDLKGIYLLGGHFDNKCTFKATKKELFEIFQALDEFIENDYKWNEVDKRF